MNNECAVAQSTAPSPLSATTHQISVTGQMKSVPAWRVGDLAVIVTGSLIKVAEIFDAYWLEADRLPDPRDVVQRLSTVAGKPDLFTFTQRVPETEPKFDFHLDWDNVAVIPVSTHAHWLQKQISPATRRNVKTSEKKGVVVRISPFDEQYHPRDYGGFGRVSDPRGAEVLALRKGLRHGRSRTRHVPRSQYLSRRVTSKTS